MATIRRDAAFALPSHSYDAGGRVPHQSLQIKLAIVACTYMAIVLAAIGMSALMVRSWDRAVDDRSDARILSREVSDLRLAYSDQEAGIRDYRVGLDESLLAPYRSGSSLEAVMTRRIREHSGPLDQRLLDTVEAAAERWQLAFVEPSLALDRPTSEVEPGKQLYDELRRSLDELDSIVADRVTEAAERAQRAERSTLGVLFASALGAIAGTALINLLFRRWITQPLGAIVDVSRRLADDEATPMPEFDSAELQEVGDAIGSLQLSLRRERDRAVAAYEALEQSANLALHIRSELAEQLGELPGGWSVACEHEPAEGLVAGDCYDLSLIDQRRFYAIVIDVTGHGAAAALQALNAKTELRAALRSRQSPGQALASLSRHRRHEGQPVVLTAFVALIDIESGWCEYANGGHPPPLITDGSHVVELEATGPLIGAFDAEWDTRRVQIPVDASLVIFTDGVTEALGPARARFGEQRLESAVTGGNEVDPQRLVKRVIDDVDRFRAGEARRDDTTIVVVHRGTGVANPAILATLQA